MSFLLDLVLLGLLAYSIWAGYRKGVIKALVRLGLLLASVLGARWVAAAVTPRLAEQLPLPGVGTKLASFLNARLPQTGAKLGALLAEWGFPPKAAQSMEALWDQSANAAGDSIARKLTPVVDRFLAEILVFLFVFIIFWLASALLANILDKSLEMPVLDRTNRLLGLSAGLLSGLLALSAIALILSWAAPLLDVSFDLTLMETVQRSFVLRTLRGANPLAFLLG